MVVEARSRFADLVQEEAVHRSLYTDPAIFEVEMRRVFGRTWIFIAHESEIPSPGDFKTDEVAGQPLIISRHTDGQVHVLFNTCRHRGAVVCEFPSGNASGFRCPYHAWTYKTNGELAVVPSRELFGDDFDTSELSLWSVPRVASYRGFIFISFTHDGPSLDEHLGRAKHYIDIFVDRSPAGQIRATPPLKYEYRANWKLQMENMSDNYHAQYVHASAFGGNWGATSNRSPAEGQARSVERSFGHGFGILDYRGGRQGVTVPEKYPEYFNLLAERHGEERARDLATIDIHLMVWPNLILHTNYSHYRVVRPLAVDHTEINTYPCKLVGAPGEVNAALVRATALHVSPAGRVQVDDLEAFNRVRQGLQANVDGWVLFRMHGLDEHVNEDGELECRVLSEMIPRGYYREWLRLMEKDWQRE